MHKQVKFINSVRISGVIALVCTICAEFRKPEVLFDIVVEFIPGVSGHRAFAVNAFLGIFCSIVVVYLSERFTYEYEKRKILYEIDYELVIVKEFLLKVKNTNDLKEYLGIVDEYKDRISASSFSNQFYLQKHDKDKKEYIAKISLIEPNIYSNFLLPSRKQRYVMLEKGISNSLLELYSQRDEYGEDAVLKCRISKEKEHISEVRKRELNEMHRMAYANLNQLKKIEKKYGKVEASE